jgi:hypothetical protein
MIIQNNLTKSISGIKLTRFKEKITIAIHSISEHKDSTYQDKIFPNNVRKGKG